MKTILTAIFSTIQIVLSIVQAQVSNTGIMDTTGGTNLGKLSIGGYIDTYYGAVFSETSENNIPYFVSMNRSNEANINLAYIDLRYQTPNFRARFVPGFGTYINSNYAAEQGTLRNIVEASAGFKLFKKKEVWLDAGVLGSPYTNESAISRDHLMYTRSFAPEYVPYYLSGIKISVPLSNKINAFLYLINGWQQIKDNNSGKSIGTQIEYKPNNNNLFNWNTYLGDERSSFAPNFRMRYFTDIVWVYNKNKVSATACAYIGNQKMSDSLNVTTDNIWWQTNIIGRYSFTSKFSVSGRIEYFNDENNIQILPINPVGSFNTFSGGLCLNFQINENALFRLEGRQFWSAKNNYLDSNGDQANRMTWVVSNITVWF